MLIEVYSLFSKIKVTDIYFYQITKYKTVIENCLNFMILMAYIRLGIFFHLILKR